MKKITLTIRNKKRFLYLSLQKMITTKRKFFNLLIACKLRPLKYVCYDKKS